MADKPSATATPDAAHSSTLGAAQRFERGSTNAMATAATTTAAISPELAVHAPPEAAQEDILQCMHELRTLIAGGLLVRRDATAPIGAEALAVVAPSQHPLQRDRARLLVPQEATEEEKAQNGGMGVILKEKYVTMASLSTEYTMLVPNLITLDPSTPRWRGHWETPP